MTMTRKCNTCEMHKLKFDKVCKKCNKPFSTNFTQKVYCSSKGQAREPIHALKEILCVSCGTTFKQSVYNSIYCSWRCNRDSANKAKRDNGALNGIKAKTKKPKPVIKKVKKKKQYTLKESTTVKKTKVVIEIKPIDNGAPRDGHYGINDKLMIDEYIINRDKKCLLREQS